MLKGEAEGVVFSTLLRREGFAGGMPVSSLALSNLCHLRYLWIVLFGAEQREALVRCQRPLKPELASAIVSSVERACGAVGSAPQWH